MARVGLLVECGRDGLEVHVCRRMCELFDDSTPRHTTPSSRLGGPAPHLHGVGAAVRATPAADLLDESAKSPFVERQIESGQ
jgi:hypothetical protein